MQYLSTRRTTLQHLAGMATCLSAAGAFELSAASAPHLPSLGLQLYTVGTEMGKSVRETLQRIAAAGYTDVELSFSRYSTEELRVALKEFGLRSISGHYTLPELIDTLPQKIAIAKDFGQEYMVVSLPWVADPSRFEPAADNRLVQLQKVLRGLTIDDWKWNCEQFNKIGEQTKKAGLQLAYHNHNFEFKPLEGSSGYDEIIRLTDPVLLKLELDCGWMTVGGKNPADYLRQYPGRFPLLHARDFRRGYRVTNAFMDDHPGAPVSTELGQGAIDYADVLKLAGKQRLRAVYVEQDPPVSATTTLDSIRVDYRYLRKLLP